MQNIDSYDFSGKKAIVRVDFNVPLDSDFNITDDTRIRAAIPTLKKVLAGGGSLIIMSHLGKPKGPAEKFSLKHIIGRIEELLGTRVQFAPDCMKADEQAAALKPGEVLLLENLRFYAEEEGKPRGLAEDATEEERRNSPSTWHPTPTATSTTHSERPTGPTHPRPSSPSIFPTTRCSAT